MRMREEMCGNLIWNSLLSTFYNIKSKVKDIFDFGGNYQIVPPLLPTIITSPITF